MSVMSTNASRRAVLAAGAATGAVVATGVQSPAASAALVRVRPSPAHALVNAFGIDIHLNHQKSAYGNHAQVAHWLTKLGVRHVRSRLSLLPGVLDAFEDLASRGIRVQGTCGALGDPQSMDSIMRTVKSRYTNPGKVFAAFEGINEPNNDGVPWIDETRQKTQDLFAARAKYGLTGIPIVAPALARVTNGGVQGDTTSEQAANLGDLSQYVDFGNMHVYPQGLQPSNDIGYFRGCSRKVTADHRIMCTEGGYFTAMGYHGGPNPVPEKVAASYAPQALLEHWIAGTTRFFRYELLDDPSPSSTDREGTLGMIRTGGTWRPKPDFAPMRHLLHAFADQGPAFAPRPLDINITGRPWGFRHAVFAKRNGQHIIAMWLDRKIYDPRSRKMVVGSLSSALGSVHIELGARRDVRVKHLNTLGATTYRRNTRSFGVGLPAGVTLVKLG